MVITGCAPGEQPSCPPSRHSLSCCPYRKTIRVKIVDEEEYERQENFFIALGEPKWMERGISGVRFFKNQSNNQEKAKKKERNLNKRGNNKKEKVTLIFAPTFCSLLLLLLLTENLMLFRPVFSLPPCFGVISAFLVVASFHIPPFPPSGQCCSLNSSLP